VLDCSDASGSLDGLGAEFLRYASIIHRDLRLGFRLVGLLAEVLREFQVFLRRLCRFNQGFCFLGCQSRPIFI